MTCKTFKKATRVTRMVPVRGSTGIFNRLLVRKRKALSEQDYSDLSLEFITEVHLLSSGDRRSYRRKL
jgi:hypothetical protein